jgi:hypothetical protein
MREEPMIEQPFFIVGSERSGTTLLRLMLDHHPRLACHFEFEHSVEKVGDDGSFPELDGYRDWLPTTRSFSTSGASIDASLDYRELIDSFLEQKRQRDGKEFIGATVHKHFDRLLHIWPDARFIHIVRDPRDVAPSCVAMGWAGNVWGGVERWLDAERLWETLVPRLDAVRYYEFGYESLIRDARKILGEICSFLGVAFDEAMFSYAQTSTYDLPTPSRVELWRRQASQRDVQLVEARTRELLLRRGYVLSDYPELDLSARAIAKLEAENRRRRRLFRLKRYGLPLFVAENVTRRLPLRPLHSLFAKRMEAIDEQFIK